MRAYWIEGPWKGRLAIVPRPRGGDWLESEVSEWREAGIDVIVSFLTPEEVAELGLEAEEHLCGVRGIRFISFPIPDRGTPASNAEAAALVGDLEKSLANNYKVALHCRQSVGRSSLMAAYLLVRAGEDVRYAFEQISSVRGGKVPDTAEQEGWVADRGREYKRTKGERLFEAYLRLQGITSYEFERSHPGKLASPDYTVTLDRDYLFEIKSFEPTDILTSSGFYDPYRRIRQKIDEGREKFREYKGSPCCLVLYDNNARLVHLESPTIMLGAMYGNVGVSIDFNADLGELDATTAQREFHDSGKMIRPNSSEPQNTTISALMTLRYVEAGQRKLRALHRLTNRKHDIALEERIGPDPGFDKNKRQLGVIVWENAFARIPFPRSLFCGPYDMKWGQGEDKLEIERVFVGSEIAALENLEASAASLHNAG